MRTSTMYLSGFAIAAVFGWLLVVPLTQPLDGAVSLRISGAKLSQFGNEVEFNIAVLNNRVAFVELSRLEWNVRLLIRGYGSLEVPCVDLCLYWTELFLYPTGGHSGRFWAKYFEFGVGRVLYGPIERVTIELRGIVAYWPVRYRSEVFQAIAWADIPS